MNKKGFTVVEILVAMGVFMVVITITSGVFIRSLRTQRATVALIAANSNAGLALEQMAREIRTGQSFSAASDQLNFINAKGENVSYRWNSANQALEKSVNTGAFKPVTAENVEVRNLNFRLFQGSPADPYPNRITVVLQIGTKDTTINNTFANLQTTISARVLETVNVLPF